ncbi:MAG: pepsin/retropepsin-like aspartic protease family protein [Pseudomonadota bacterium]|nr:pepsin/retropepsin-like aspartic protease family protein [Pseudomonadota bacterium]
MEQTVAVAADQADRLAVPVSIGGRGWNFLIDTASTRTVVASDVADSMGLEKGDALQILSIAGTETVPSVIIPDLVFSNLALRDIHSPALLRKNLGGDGLLGLDILRNSRVSIDFRHASTLTISPSSGKSHKRDGDDDPGAIVVEARSRFGELVVTSAEIDGISTAVILDTGSESSIGNPALANRLTHNSVHSLGSTTLVSVTGQKLPVSFGVIDKLLIGQVTIADVPIVFGDVATFRQFKLLRRPAMLLGMDTLRQFARVTIDFPQREIKFWLRHDARESRPDRFILGSL